MNRPTPLIPHSGGRRHLAASLSLAVILAAGLAEPVRAEAPVPVRPPAAAASDTAAAPQPPQPTDQVVLWQWNRLAPEGPAHNDLTVYYVKQFWLTPDTGIYTFANTSNSAALRLMHRMNLPGDFQLTAMGGLRVVAFGNAPPTPSVQFREGPEVALALNHALFGPVSGQIFGSYAALFPLNASAIPAGTPNEGNHFIFYGLNLIAPIGNKTNVMVGVMGHISQFYSAGLQFHNLGPTATVNHAF